MQDYIIRIIDEGEVVQTIETGKQSEAMIEVAKYLSDEHNLLAEVEIPYSPGRRKHPLIGKMNSLDELPPQRHEFTEECYVDTLANKETKKRNIRRIIEAVGFEAGFDGLWNN